MYGINDEIIYPNLELMNERIGEVFKKYGLEFEFNPMGYNFELFQRCESIYIPESEYSQFFKGLSDKYTTEDLEYFDIRYFLPSKFGVYRGWAGGGIHGELLFNETEVLSTELKTVFPKIEEFLSEIETEFRNTFWKILKDTDEFIESETGETVEIWESSTL
jgi:hypothetical protein